MPDSFANRDSAERNGVSSSKLHGTKNLTAMVFWGVLMVFLTAAITSLSLLFVVLLDKTTKQSGIATLEVNLSSLPEPTALFHRSHAFENDVLQSLASDIHSFSGDAATVIDGAASEVATVARSVQTIVGSVIQSAETAVATALQNATQTFYNTTIPRSLSFGTESFCINYLNDTMRCASLPLNLTHFLPEVVDNLFDNHILSLQQLEEDLVDKVLGIFHGSLVAGIASILGIGLLVFLLCRYLLLTRLWLRLFIMLTIGAVCLVPFILLAAMSSVLKRKLGNAIQGDLSPLLHIQLGKVGDYILAALCWAIVMLVAAIVILLV
uniref:Na(+)/H(+) antiporter NhaA 2 n=1 Tax=Talaromyces marneffei PM1 TaxID=1077442 RepID=A0A093UUP1_TALMA